MTNRVPIADVDFGEDEIEAAVSVLESGYVVQGEEVTQFEESFAESVGANHAVAVSSGTAALHIVYLALLEAGDDVLVPSFSHISTASMIPFADGRPIFCDVDPETHTLDVNDAAERLTEDTTTIVPVHLFGSAANIDAITTFARGHDLNIVWDAAQAHGTTYQGRDVGSFGDVVCYSFYPTKNMTSIEGGMIVTDDDDLAGEFRLLRSHWQTEKYYHPDLGLNYRMTDVEAAVGREQLSKLADLVGARRENAAVLDEELADIGGVRPQRVPDGVEHSYHQYTVVVDTDERDMTRDGFRASLDEQGIDTAVHYPRPIHEQPAFVDRYGETSLPVSEHLADRVVSLPVHPGLDQDDLSQIVRAVRHAMSD